MKQLLAFTGLLFVIGIASFLYRNTMERPGSLVPPVACTMEAKICPDGSSVGRSGASCSFAPCALPNVELPLANISFALPSGYTLDADLPLDDGDIAAYSKPATLDWPAHAIVVSRFPVAEGETAEEVILANTRYQPADEQATDLSRFKDVPVTGKTFKETLNERFEGLVHTSYFLVRESDVLRFEVIEKGVQNWTDASLDIRTLPEHQALLGMLRTLQSTP